MIPTSTSLLMISPLCYAATMFEKTLTSSAKTIYWLTIGCVAVGLGWLCFAHLPFWFALIVLPFALMLAALAGAPLAAGAGLVGGVVMASVVWLSRKAAAAARSRA
ncbi:hypothetical protein R0381_003655 [Jeongeupia wiesaeckerbachi]|uniref:hypothetical protein n=1 Tax=Jeongeupia wiesaeckerbachi TaxID=3051218 RepID=UPI003D802C7B